MLPDCTPAGEGPGGGTPGRRGRKRPEGLGKRCSLDPAALPRTLKPAPVARLMIFLLVVLAIVGGVHFYLWTRLVRDTHLPAPFRVWLTASVIAFAVAMPATLLLLRRLPATWSALAAWPVFVWMGMMFLAFVVVLAGDLVRLVVLLGARVGGS